MRPPALTLVLALLAPGVAWAQVRDDPMPSTAFLVEIDALVGYTPVELERWASVERVARRERQSAGLHARVFLVFLGSGRFGFEAGYQRLFSYELVTQTGSLVTRERYNVDPIHVGVVGRHRATANLAIDYGLGFYYVSDETLGGFHAGATYSLVRRGRLAVPVGARIGMVFAEQAVALPLGIKLGASLQP